jgi:putative ABC transport system substrate-binding protein
MRRREFIALGGVIAIAPLRSYAQPAVAGRRLIGVLSPQTRDGTARNIEAMRAGLRELGHVEGRDIWLEFRYANGELARLPALAAELVSLKSDIIVAGSAAGALAAHGATKTIPILMFSIVDPVALGVVKSIARPGGNVTGIWMFAGSDALIGKRIELLKEVVPALSQMGVIASSADPADEAALHRLPAATRSLGVTYKVFDVRTPAALEAAFAQAKNDGMQALFINQNPFLFTHRTQVADLATRERLPAITGYREFTEAGGLMSYGSSLASGYRQSARLLDKILKGANPADLPVEQAAAFELVVNNKTAKALGLKIPESFLLRADEVIE